MTTRLHRWLHGLVPARWGSRGAAALLLATSLLAALPAPAASLAPQVRPGRATAVDMPDLRNRPVDEARAILREMELEATLEPLPPGSGPSGVVLRHLPGPGAPVTPGTLVRLWVSRAQDVPTVPDVRGEPLEGARELLDRVGIRVRTVRTVPVDPGAMTYVPPAPGTVVRQRPSAGSPVERGASATLWVAEHAEGAAETVEVPGVVGLPLEEAVGRMKEAGIGVSDVVRVRDDAPAGTVVEQQPTPGERVPPGSSAVLAVAEGVEVRVPELRGTPLPEARERLAAAGLEAARISEMEAGEPAGTVLRQSPAPGRSVRPGTGVDLAVSAGPVAAEERVVPDVVGREVEAAEAELLEAGLAPGRVDAAPADAPRGTVVDQWPPAGALAGPGAAVRLRVSSGPGEGGPVPATVPVPEVVGLERGTATALLADVGLRAVDTRGDGDRVVEQFPSPGTLVSPGTPVLLTLQARTGPVPAWLRDWRTWAVPAGLAVLWVLLRIRRVSAARTGGDGGGAHPRPDGEPAEEKPEEEEPDPRTRVEYRLARRAPTGAVEVDGPLLPELEVGLRPRPGRPVRVTLAVHGDGPRGPATDPDPPGRSRPS